MWVFIADGALHHGETWEIDENDGGAPSTIEVTVDGDELTVVRQDGEVVTWTRVDIDPEADLTLC